MSPQAETKWDEFWVRVGAKSAPTAHFASLMAHYSEPHRAYHNLGHILDCLEQFEPARRLAHDPAAVEMAIWYHDIIYDPRAKDNEERSADVAEGVAREIGLAMPFRQNLKTLILATKKHEVSLAPDAGVLVDIDLSILGRAPARFDEYERQIRNEYAWVSPEAFAQGRTAVLESFLARTTIYHTDYFRNRYERQARENMIRSIQRLRKRF
jgi:predicted metal-dependent HD superfamily phosphohydrolase